MMISDRFQRRGYKMKRDPSTTSFHMSNTCIIHPVPYSVILHTLAGITVYVVYTHLNITLVHCHPIDAAYSAKPSPFFSALIKEKLETDATLSHPIILTYYTLFKTLQCC